jgi:16S rRNA (uracil1498-N3)-methyltransferase
MNTRDEARSPSSHVEYYYWDGAPEQGELVITGPEAKHIARVMRHKPGDRIAVTDGAGREYGLELLEVRTDAVSGRVIECRAGAREPERKLVLAQAALKGDKLAQACEQATELGVSEIVPLITARTVARLHRVRLERLRHVMVAAMKSSRRTLLPRLAEPVTLEDMVEQTGEFDQVLVAYEEETGPGLSRVLNRGARTVLLVIGPEGGFEPDEIELLKAAGAMTFSLGPRRLRAETAATTVVATALGLLGDLG